MTIKQLEESNSVFSSTSLLLLLQHNKLPAHFGGNTLALLFLQVALAYTQL